MVCPSLFLHLRKLHNYPFSLYDFACVKSFTYVYVKKIRKKVSRAFYVADFFVLNKLYFLQILLSSDVVFAFLRRERDLIRGIYPKIINGEISTIMFQ